MFNVRVFSKIAASLFVVFLLGMAPLSSSLFAQDYETLPGNGEWSSMESNYFVIHYDPSADLDSIEKSLTKRPLYFDQAARYGEVTARGEICARLDKLYNRVQDVLDMHPKTPMIKIIIFRDSDALNAKYAEIFGTAADLKSFYIYKYNTIYVSESDMDDSVMIHEMAHAVMDHYFTVLPPESVAEILAAYVETHLEGQPS